MTEGRGHGAPRSRSKRPGKRSLEHSHRHIDALYEIGKLLTRFDDVEWALPRIIEIVATHLPLRTAVFIQRRDEELVAWSWSSPVGTPDELRAAEEKAKKAYAYLTGRPAESLRESRSGPPAEQKAKGTEIGRAVGEHQLLTLPLVVERAPTFGVFQLGALVMEPARSLDKVDVAFVNAVANQLAIAIDHRTAWRRLLQQAHVETKEAQSSQAEAEQRLASAEESESRERLLAEASSILGRSLDYKANSEALARLLVPRLADWCMIDVVATTEPHHANTFVAHADEAKETLCREIIRRCPPDPDSQHGLSYVIRTGRPEICPDISTADWVPSALGIEYPQLLRELGAQSYMCVPLKGRGGVLGAITLIYDGSGRRYGADDLEFAEDFAWRAAAAIDNSRLYEEAQKASRVRDDLLAVVSHDLKSPLGLILMNTASLLQRPEREQFTGAARRQIEGIRRSAERMTRLIQDLLDSSSIEAGRISTQPRRVAVAPLVSEALEVLEPTAASRALRLEMDVGPDVPAVFADAARLQQILANLVGNAIKFTPDGGRIAIRAERLGEVVRFAVDDTGPGIPEEDLPHLFDRFWQAPRTARLGTGLGLFISKGLVEAQGGRLWVESTVGRGTTFFFTLPVAPETNQPGDREADPETAPERDDLNAP